MKIRDLIHDLKRFPENADVELLLSFKGLSNMLSITWEAGKIKYADSYHMPRETEIKT